MKRNDNYYLVLLGLFLVAWGIASFHPVKPVLFYFETGFIILCLSFFVWIYRKGLISPLSATFIFIYLSLHAIGAHYNYSYIPGDLNGQYDWFMHFLFGLLITYPTYFMLSKVIKIEKKWLMLFSLCIILSFSMIYEIFEWIVAVNFLLGSEYVASFGDQWDAQKDMALSIIGSLISLAFTWVKK